MLARIRKSAEEKDQGFTLIELLVVIIIIGILAAIAIPVFLRQREKGWDAAAKADLKNMATAEETYLTDNDVYTSVVDPDLTDAGFKQSTGDVTAWTAEALGANGDAGYCLETVSRSTKTFFYSSDTGVPDEGTCP
jgi:type IV pilus assembly protein PilA